MPSLFDLLWTAKEMYIRYCIETKDPIVPLLYCYACGEHHVDPPSPSCVKRFKERTK